jgi:hypothetical protein
MTSNISVTILQDELYRKFKKYLRDLSYYNLPIINRTIEENVYQFTTHLQTVDLSILDDAMTNDLEGIPHGIYGQDAIIWHNNQIQQFLDIAIAINQLLPSNETNQIVESFTVVKTILIERQFWKI